MSNKVQNLHFVCKAVFIVPAVLLFSACADNRIQHCIYGVSDKIEKIDAKLCNDVTISYVSQGDYWKSKGIISNPCEYVTIQFTYNDGRTGKYEGLYLTGGNIQITDYGKFSTNDPARIHLVQATRKEGLKICLPESDIEFTRDYTFGELCDSRYYNCPTN